MLAGDIISGMVTETKPVHIGNYLIEEQLHNEAIDREVWRETKPEPVSEHVIQERRRLLIENLTKQCPHFVHFGANGNFSRALVFRADHKFEAFMEVIQLDGDKPKRLKGEFFTGQDPKSVMGEIDWMNRRFGTTRDLLQEPDVIYRETDGSTGERSYIHIGLSDGKPIIAYRYHIHPVLPPYATGVNLADSFYMQPKGIRILKRPPIQVRRYSRQAFQG